jgi:LPXTG-site transpeptidase (sortase) family protein
MRWFRLHNLLLAIGIGLTSLGIANAASIVSSISHTEPLSPEQVGEPYEFPSPAQETVTSTAYETQNLKVPSASFLAPSRNPVKSVSNDETKDRLLSEFYAAEMLYPESLVVELPALPNPALPEIPIHLVIPTIELEAPVMPSEAEIVQISGKPYQVWHAPNEYAAGWHVSSAPLGVPGNTVLNGHHNIYGEVFKRLVELEPGDEILVESENSVFSYKIHNKMILPEKYAPLEERVNNSLWILPSEDERLTIVTCWPYESNTHRLILVASPNR